LGALVATLDAGLEMPRRRRPSTGPRRALPLGCTAPTTLRILFLITMFPDVRRPLSLGVTPPATFTVSGGWLAKLIFLKFRGR